MRKQNFTSLELQAEQVRNAEFWIFASQDRAEVREQNFTYWAVKAEQKCGSGNSHFSQCRTKVRTWNFRSLAFKAERKCGNGTSGLR